MKTESVIDSFRGEYRFLSNFWSVTIRLHGANYPSAEHAFQAAKTLCPVERSRIASAKTPGEAKKLGRRVTLRADWDELKLQVMQAIIRQKFRPGSGLARALVATAPAELVEGNEWGDRYWGVCKGVGKNHLGRLLMERRAELLDQ